MKSVPPSLYNITQIFVYKKNCDSELVMLWEKNLKKYLQKPFLQNTINTTLEHPGFDQGFQFTIHIDTSDPQDFLISISFCLENIP